MDPTPALAAISLDVPRWALEIASIAYIVVVTVFVVSERRRPTATLALLLSLIFLPVVGLLAYLLFSRTRSWQRQRLRERRQARPVDATHRVASLDELPADLPQNQRGLVSLGLKSAAAPLRHADAVELLPTAQEAYTAFERTIASAECFIHCQFYIWKDDEIGRRVTAWLTEKARQGVAVRVMYDHVGSLGLPSTHFERLRKAGGEVAVFGQIRLPTLRVGAGRLNFRNHRKILTVDGNIGLLGGLNIGAEYLDPAGDDDKWRDLHVQIAGDAVIGLDAIFIEDWMQATGEIIDLKGDRPIAHNPMDRKGHKVRPRRGRKQQAPPGGETFSPVQDRPIESAGPLLQIIPSGPDHENVSAIGAQLTAAIATAGRRAWIATPYLIPDEPLRLMLRTAALRGVDVRLLVPKPEHNDARLVAFASRSYYEELLEAGCRIYEYELGMLHAKYVVVDHVCAIGSANMDIRSFYLNFEVTAMFYDASVTAQLAAIFEGDLARARVVTIEDMSNPPFFERLAESFARVLSPLL